MRLFRKPGRLECANRSANTAGRTDSAACGTARNANESRVLSVLERFLKDRARNAGVCSCGKCFSDMVAIALNYLPPRYYGDTEDGGKLGSPWVMVEKAVAEAVEIVRESPRHASSNT